MWYMQDMIDTLEHDQLIELTEEEEAHRQKLETVFGWLTSLDQPITQREARSMAVRQWGLSVHQAYRIVRASQKLFGDLDQLETNTQRVIQTELRRKAIAEIKRDDGLTAYEKHYLIHLQMIRIETINHLEDKDTLTLTQVLELLQLPDTEFTTDPQVLNETEDVDHQEV